MEDEIEFGDDFKFFTDEQKIRIKNIIKKYSKETRIDKFYDFERIFNQDRLPPMDGVPLEYKDYYKDLMPGVEFKVIEPLKEEDRVEIEYESKDFKKFKDQYKILDALKNNRGNLINSSLIYASVEYTEDIIKVCLANADRFSSVGNNAFLDFIREKDRSLSSRKGSELEITSDKISVQDSAQVQDQTRQNIRVENRSMISRLIGNVQGMFRRGERQRDQSATERLEESRSKSSLNKGPRR